MRRAQQRMAAGRPYAERIRQVVGHLADANAEYKHDFMVERPVQKVGYILVSTDRGLCGGLNFNLFKNLIQHMQDWQKQGAEAELCIIGNKGASFFRQYGLEVSATVGGLGEAPEVSQLIGSIKIMLDGFLEGRIDRLYLVSNKFINTMSQKPAVEQLIPLAVDEKVENSRLGSWDYIYEPGAKELLDSLVVRYIESQVYQSVVENVACEQAARMIAMKNATDNAGDLISNLQLVYNKARQAAITQEITEIVSGAAAV
jgi:F-type H+-transporting ATPase subunit gamma